MPKTPSEPEVGAKDDEPVEPVVDVPAAPLPDDMASPMAGLPVGATFGSLVHAVLEHTVLAAQLRALDARLVAEVGTVLARERAALLVTFLTAALAERARSRASGRRQRLNHDRFVDHLVDVLTAALAA